MAKIILLHFESACIGGAPVSAEMMVYDTSADRFDEEYSIAVLLAPPSNAVWGDGATAVHGFDKTTCDTCGYGYAETANVINGMVQYISLQHKEEGVLLATMQEDFYFWIYRLTGKSEGAVFGIEKCDIVDLRSVVYFKLLQQGGAPENLKYMTSIRKLAKRLWPDHTWTGSVLGKNTMFITRGGMQMSAALLQFMYTNK